MQRPCFVNQTMGPVSGKRLRLRDEMRTAQDSLRSEIRVILEVISSSRLLQPARQFRALPLID